VLVDPGEQDLTSHVDFEALGAAAKNAGAKVTPLVSQGEWLIRLGIEARSHSLARANPSRVEELDAALQRLISPSALGELFKVMGVYSPQWPAPAGFA
jgi:SAM-dependent MidA family methyltransferase